MTVLLLVFCSTLNIRNWFVSDVTMTMVFSELGEYCSFFALRRGRGVGDTEQSSRTNIALFIMHNIF